MVERFILLLRRKRLYRCRECDHRFRDRPLPRRPVGRWPSGGDRRRRAIRAGAPAPPAWTTGPLGRLWPDLRFHRLADPENVEYPQDLGARRASRYRRDGLRLEQGLLERVRCADVWL